MVNSFKIHFSLQVAKYLDAVFNNNCFVQAGEREKELKLTTVFLITVFDFEFLRCGAFRDGVR